MIYMTIKTLWTGAGNDLMILILKKLILIHLIIQVSGSIDVKMDGSISSKLVGYYIVSIFKSMSKTIGVLLVLSNCFILRLLSVSINLPCILPRNTVVNFVLVLLALSSTCI